MAGKLIRALAVAGSSGDLVARAARTFVVNVLGVGLSFALHFVFARLLGVSDYGLYVYIISWVTVLSMLCVVGFDAASLRFVAEYRARAEHHALRAFLQFAKRRALAVSVSVAVVLAVLAEALGISTDQGRFVPYLVGALLPLTVVLLLYGYFLQGMTRADEAQLLQLVLRPVCLIVGCGVIAWYVDHPGVLDVLVLTLGVTALIGAIEAWRLRRLVATAPMRPQDTGMQAEWNKTASSLFLITLAQQVLANGDILLVGLLLGTTDAGIYGAAAKLAVVVSFATSSTNLILAPTIADLFACGRKDALQAAVTVATSAAVLYAVPVLAVMLMSGGWLLGQFGEGFQRGYWVLAILCLGQGAITINGAAGFLMTMTGNHKPALRVIGLSAALMVVLAVLLGKLWGIVGVAAGTALALTFRSIVLGYLVHKRLGINATPRWPTRGNKTVLLVTDYLKRRYPRPYGPS